MRLRWITIETVIKQTRSNGPLGNGVRFKCDLLGSRISSRTILSVGKRDSSLMVVRKNEPSLIYITLIYHCIPY